MRRMGMFAGWLVVVAATTFVTWQIVGAADAQVSDRPASPLNVAAPTPDSTTTTTATAPTSAPTTTTTIGTTTTTDTSTTTSSPAQPSSTEASWSLMTRQTSGGTVVLRYRPGEVALQAATPAPGFSTEIDKKGPPKVEVEFESESAKVEIHAQWEDSGVQVEVSEDGD